MKTDALQAPQVLTLKLGGAHVLLVAEFDTPALRAFLTDIATRTHAPEAEVLHAGRNRTVKLDLTTVAGASRAVVVKSFGPQGVLRDWQNRRNGSKAERSFRVAVRLYTAGVGTPPPIACVEHWKGGRLVASFFVSQFEPNLTCFRDELIRLYRHEPLCSKVISLLQVVADAVRALHAVGVLHNDLGNQNIMLRRKDAATWSDVQFVDLNRARFLERPSLRAIARDLSRLALPSDLLRVFFEMYFQARAPADFLRWERHYRLRFAWHSCTRRFRHPLRERRARATENPATTYPPLKDIWLWDDRSAQAISTLTHRDRRRLHPAGSAVRVAAAVLAGAWPVWRAYRRLRQHVYRAPVDLTDGIGMAVEPRPESFERERQLLAGLGKIPVLVRFYHHATPAEREFTARAARQLHSAGHPLALALVQDRRAVREPARWRDFVFQTLENVGAIAEWAEVGHAINRVKWGLWDWRDYAQLLEPVLAQRKHYPHLRLMGPAAIDFEYHYLLAVLRRLPRDFRFDALAHHLYVDRRGAPENFQGRFSVEEKFTLARAIADWSPALAPQVIISETNWPLLGTGVWSPVGSPYETPGPRGNDPSVSEQDYADYMLRYLVIALTSGMVARVYWWRLAAHGFGLVDSAAADPAYWRLRPAYHQLQTFLRYLGAATFVGHRRLPDGARYFFFRAPNGARHACAYAHPTPTAFRPPGACREIRNALGAVVPAPAQLTGQPVYLLDLE
jgi:tRNA A-37 threonylcarbamoyl transferase component Bud32